MNSEIIPLFSTVHNDSTEKAMIETFRTGAIASGSNVSLLESQLSGMLGLDDLVTLADMTSAIYFALLLSGVTCGDRVMTTSFACLATTSAIAQLGAEPVWVDLDKETLTFCCDDAKEKLCSRVKAVLVYHVAGYPADSQRIFEFCESHNLKLIEDCNNAMFAQIGDSYVGNTGHYSVFSFYPNRQINGIEGGALYCKNKDDRDRARRLRRYGIDSLNFRDQDGEIRVDLDIKEHGWSLTMNNLNCAVAVAQLDDAESRVETARNNARVVFDSLKDIEQLVFIAPTLTAKPSFWVLLALTECRDVVLKRLKKQGVMVSKLHQCNDQYSFFRSSAFNSHLPVTREIEKEIIAFPIGWWISRQQLNDMISKIKLTYSSL